MWVVKFLNGEKAGKVFSINEDVFTVGRATQNHLSIKSHEISKLHAQFEKNGDQLYIKDKSSSNGTFVNHVKVKSQKLKSKDKISFHNIVCQVTYISSPMEVKESPLGAMKEEKIPEVKNPLSPIKQAQKQLDLYLEKAVLGGVYKMTEWFDMRSIIGIFTGLFIILVTVLSSIPLIKVLKLNVEKESLRRAYSLSKTISKINRPFLDPDHPQEANIEIDFIQKEKGVKKAYILKPNGMVIAPFSLAGQHIKDDFVHEMRKQETEVTEIKSGKVYSMVPIQYFDPQLKSPKTVAYSLIVYESASIQVDDGATISFIFQSFIIAILIGSILFFFLYKIFEYPIRLMNHQIQKSLNHDGGNINVQTRSPFISKLTDSINILLNKSQSSLSDNIEIKEADRHIEMTNLIQMTGHYAMIISSENQRIEAKTEGIEELLSSNEDLSYKSINELSDLSLKKSLENLINQVNNNPDQIASKELSFQGYNHQIAIQGIYGSQSIAYFLVVFKSLDEESSDQQEGEV